MDAKDKAKELVKKYLSIENALNVVDLPYMTFTKQCALIAVDEILDIFYNIDDIQAWYYSYWDEVKTEINKL